MHFLIDGDLPRSVAQVIREQGHEVTDVRDVGLGKTPDETVAAYALREHLCLLSGDFGFADIRSYPPEIYNGIAILGFPDGANREFILHLVESFLDDADVLTRLPGRLAIVEPGRVRLRPA